MDRQMSYELDGAFSQRNAGELQTVHVAKTRIGRTGGLTALRQGDGFHTKRLTTARSAKPLFQANISRLPTPRSASLAIPVSENAGDLADYDMGAINLPVIGTLNVTQILIGAVLGMVAMKTIGHFAKRR